MMQQLFSFLTRAVEGMPLLALGAAALWGMLSVVLSPCHLASIPLIVGFISDQRQVTTRRALAISSLFAGGTLITIFLSGAITAAAGRMIGDIGGWTSYAVAVVFFALGLHLLGALPAPCSGTVQVGFRPKGLWAALVLGLVSGIAVGPCTFAYMAPVLGVCFKLGVSSLAYGVLLLLAYGIGHCAVLVVAGTSSSLIQRYLDWTGASSGAAVIRSVCGVLLLAGGLYLLYTAK